MRIAIAIEQNGHPLGETTLEWSADAEINRIASMRALDELIAKTEGASWDDGLVIKLLTRE